MLIANYRCGIWFAWRGIDPLMGFPEGMVCPLMGFSEGTVWLNQADELSAQAPRTSVPQWTLPSLSPPRPRGGSLVGLVVWQKGGRRRCRNCGGSDDD